MCFLSVDSVVTSSTTSLSTEALERSTARSSQRVGVHDHRIDVLLLAPVLRLKREWSLALTCASACCWLCSFLACSWLCSFLACSWLCSFLAFSPSSSKRSISPKLCWSCVRSTASLRFRTLFTCCAWTGGLKHHTLPSSARCACRGCVSRARLLWVVTPFQATTILLVSSCVHLT